MTMGIDKACREGSRVELGMVATVQLLPLLDTNDTPLIVNRNEGAWRNLTTVNKVV